MSDMSDFEFVFNFSKFHVDGDRIFEVIRFEAACISSIFEENNVKEELTHQEFEAAYGFNPLHPVPEPEEMQSIAQGKEDKFDVAYNGGHTYNSGYHYASHEEAQKVADELLTNLDHVYDAWVEVSNG